jgi:anti-anti-sigma factor
MAGSVEISVHEWNTPQGRHLQIQDSICCGRHALRLSGELDIASAPDLAGAIVRICTSSTHAITLDLSKLTFIDSTGLAAIISVGRKCEQLACEFRLIPGPPAVQRVFELTGLHDKLSFAPAAPASTT